VGAGGSLEAEYRLAGPIKAGSWHLVGDGIIVDSCDMTFEVVWRAGATDKVVTSFTHHFDPLPSTAPNPFDATPYAADATAAAVPAGANDQLVLRIRAAGTMTQSILYIPNGDGAKAHGDIPSLKLP